jgi:hypothetical protein
VLSEYGYGIIEDERQQALEAAAAKPAKVGIRRKVVGSAAPRPRPSTLIRDFISSSRPPCICRHAIYHHIDFTSLHLTAAHVSAKSCIDTATAIPSTSHHLIMLVSPPPAQYTSRWKTCQGLSVGGDWAVVVSPGRHEPVHFCRTWKMLSPV